MKLTEKQELFSIAYVLNGGDATNAYKEVYNTKTDKMTTVYANASKVLKVNKVATRIHELQMERFNPQIITIEERKVVLSQMAKDKDTKAIDILNKMDGVYDANIDKEVEVTSISYRVLPKNG